MTRRRTAPAWKTVATRPYQSVGSTLRSDTLAEIATQRAATRRTRNIVNNNRRNRKATRPPTTR